MAICRNPGAYNLTFPLTATVLKSALFLRGVRKVLLLPMKPNLIVIQPMQPDSDPAIDSICEMLCETYYVYVIRPLRTFRDDSPAGVRFLNYSYDRLPGFSLVETVIIVNGSELAGRLKTQYPSACQLLWNGVIGAETSAEFIPKLSHTIVQGEFGHPAAKPFARAI